MSRRVYIKITGTSTGNYEIYNDASMSTTLISLNSSSYSGSGSENFGTMWPVDTSTTDEVYEFYVYNNSGSTIYLSNDNNSTNITITNNSWSTATSGNGHNPWEKVSYFTWTVTTSTASPVTSYIITLTPNDTYLYLYITDKDTSAGEINYQLFSKKNDEYGTENDTFSGLLSTVSGGSSLALANSFKPAHATGATFINTSSDPGSFNIYITDGKFTDSANKFYANDTLGFYNYTDIFYEDAYFRPDAADGRSSGGPSTWKSLFYVDEDRSLYWASSTTDSSATLLFSITQVCFPPFTLIETPNGLTQIGDLKVGDEVKTQGGIVKVSKNMTTHTPGGATFVFFPKDCICEGFPSEDAYITEFHPIAIKNVEEDNKDVMHFIEARHFINKFKGIELKKLDTKTYHNLVFDTVEIFNVGGMKMCSHHPNNTPIKLRKDEFLGEVNEREPVNLYYTFEKLLEDKKEDEDLGEYLKKKIGYLI